jgi:hypothetical protein
MNPGYGTAGRVNILKNVKVNGAWSLCPAVVESKGKLKDKVRVKGVVEVHPEGQYFIEWSEGPKRKREQITERTELLDRARRKSLEIEVGRIGVPVASLEAGQEAVVLGPTVQEAVAAYLENIKPPQREPKTYVAYKSCLETFAATCAKRHVAEVKREDVLAYIRHLYSNGNGGRTAYNRAVIVAQMLKANGVVNLLQKRDWPDYVEPMQVVYEPEELLALFAACTAEERTL